MSEHNTIGELLRDWDAGNTVWSIEMGGLGPGYEQAIQILAVELMRDQVDHELPTDETYPRWGDETVHRLKHLGFSGAQVGAAKQIAYRFIKFGPAAALASCPQDRKILVSKTFPSVEVQPVS